MESSSTGGRAPRDPARFQLHLLAAVLFVSYLCVAIPLPVVPVHVAGTLGLGNVWAGLAVGVAFLSTIVTRGAAGGLSDRRGAMGALARGLVCYAGGGLISMLAGLPVLAPSMAFPVLLAGRLLVGLGESLVGAAGCGRCRSVEDGRPKIDGQKRETALTGRSCRNRSCADR